MARIPEQELERLKREVDLVALVRSKGISLEAHGKDLIGLCPFHNDKNPSLIVTPNKNLWHCLGACNTGGSAIDWIMKTEGVSFRHAVEILRSGNAATLVSSGKILGKNTIPRLEAPVSYDADDQTAIRQVVDYYHETLKRSPVALEYLEKRGIKPKSDGKYYAGVSMGPVAVSYDVLEIALEVFKDEMMAEDVYLDFDPYFLMALAMKDDRDAWESLEEKSDQIGTLNEYIPDLSVPVKVNSMLTDGAIPMPTVPDVVFTVNISPPLLSFLIKKASSMVASISIPTFSDEPPEAPSEKIP